MKRTRLIIILISLLFISLSVFYLMRRSILERVYDSAYATDGDASVKLYERGNEAYFFLPSYAGFDKWQLILPEGNSLQVGEEKVNTGDSLQSLLKGADSNGHSYSVSCSFISKEASTDKTLIIMKSENIPALFINTASGSMDAILADEEHFENGRALLIDENSVKVYSGPFEKLKGRGRTSWKAHLEKKPYNLKLMDKENLLQMGKAKRWCLIANARDGSMLRNALTYDMADKIGLSFTPDSGFIDLYLNGDYAGTYQFTEKVEAAENRVELKSGGFLIEGNRSNDEVPGYFDTERHYHVEIKYPKKLNEDQIASIREAFQEAEDGIYEGGYRDTIDVDSFALKYLIDEVSKNLDAVRSSAYYYRINRGGKLFAGPAWDYDIAYGNVIVPSISLDIGRPQGITRLLISHKTTDNIFSELLKDEDFSNRVRELYIERVKPFLEWAIFTGLDSLYQEIACSSAMDDARYALAEDNYSYVKPNKVTKEHVEALKGFLTERMSFLDRVYIDGITYHDVFFMDGELEYDRLYVAHGEKCPAVGVPSYKHDETQIFQGFFDENGNEFVPGETIEEDKTYYARWEK